MRSQTPDLAQRAEALVSTLPFAVALSWQVVAMRARAQHPKTAVHEQPVICRGAADQNGLARQKLANPIPSCASVNSYRFTIHPLRTT